MYYSNYSIIENNNNNNNNKPFYRTTYKSAVESLIHLSRCTRSDVSFYVSKVSRCAEHRTLVD